MKLIILVGLSLIIMSCGSANKKQAIETPVPQTQVVDGKQLVLQGQGFRIGSKMGFTAKVYKLGFYTEKKFATAKEVMASKAPKKLYMRFTYTVTKGQMVDGWKKAYAVSCNRNCEATKKYFTQFLNAITGMKVGQEMELIFTSKGVDMNVHKEVTTKTTMPSADFSHNLLSVFIGEKVLDEKFKKTVMGMN